MGSPEIAFRLLDAGAPDDHRAGEIITYRTRDGASRIDPDDLKYDFQRDDLAEDIAAFYMDDCDGWEDNWPIHFEILLNEEPIGRYTAHAALCMDKRVFEVGEFDPSAEPERLARIENSKKHAEELIERFQFTQEVEAPGLEVWKCAEPGTGICHFRIVVTPSGTAILGDIDGFTLLHGYGIEWIAGREPETTPHPSGYYFEKVRSHEWEDWDQAYFPMKLVALAARRIVKLKAQRAVAP